MYYHAGKNFSYLEVQKVPNRFIAYLGSFIFGIVGVLISTSFLRSTWLKLLPQPGAMPDKQKIYKGYWTNNIVAVPEGDDSKIVRAEIKVSKPAAEASVSFSLRAWWWIMLIEHPYLHRRI